MAQALGMAIDEGAAEQRGAAAQPDGATPPPDLPLPSTARPGLVKAQLAAETLRLYAGDWARFQRYCAECGRAALPAHPDLVASFLATSRCGRAALARRLAAIDHQHRERGLPPPGLDPSVRAGLRQARRAAPRQTRAARLTTATLARMADTCRGDLVCQRDRALLLLLAAGFGRAAIVAVQAEHLRFTEAGLAVTTRRGGEPLRTHCLPRSASPAACPVRAVEDWLRASATRYGPVFRKINRWGQLEHAALGADAIRLILARRARPSGRLR